jgi:hypothetical protein
MPRHDSPPEGPLLDMTEVQALLGGRLSRTSLFNAVNRGELPGGVRVGRRVLVKRAVLEAWLAGDTR